MSLRRKSRNKIRGKIRDRELDRALTESEQHLAWTAAAEREMEPKLRRLERAIEQNHIYDAIVQTFRVVR